MIAKAKRGKKRPQHVVEALRAANFGRKLSEEQRAKMPIGDAEPFRPRPRGDRGLRRRLNWSARDRQPKPLSEPGGRSRRFIFGDSSWECPTRGDAERRSPPLIPSHFPSQIGRRLEKLP
jgi:hypothetical protein